MRAPLFEQLSVSDRRRVLASLRAGTAPTDPRLAPPLIQHSRMAPVDGTASVLIVSLVMLGGAIWFAARGDTYHAVYMAVALLVLGPIGLRTRLRPKQVRRSVASTESLFNIADEDVPSPVLVKSNSTLGEDGTVRQEYTFREGASATIGALATPFFPPLGFVFTRALWNRDRRAARLLLGWSILWTAVWLAVFVPKAFA